jgi:hypothetical protein
MTRQPENAVLVYFITFFCSLNNIKDFPERNKTFNIWPFASVYKFHFVLRTWMITASVV